MSNLPAIILVHGFWGGAAHWSKVILELKRLGHDNLHAVELPLTSLADDAERTRKMIAQQQGPVLLVGHSYGGAVITEAGNQPNVVGLVYIAAFAPDSGESPGGITQEHLPLAAANLAPDSDGYLWVKADRFHESFCQDLLRTKGWSWASPRRLRWPALSAMPSAARPGRASPPGTRFPAPIA